MAAVGESATNVKIISDTVARGDCLVIALGPTYGEAASNHVLSMFTNLLPNTHGVSNDLFSADVARIRKSLDRGQVAGIGATMGTAHGLPDMQAQFPTIGPGGGAFGINPSPVPPPIAALPGVQQHIPRHAGRQDRRPPRPSRRMRLGSTPRDRPVGAGAAGGKGRGAA